MSNYKVGYFVGSLSTSSINRLLAKALVRLAPAELDLTEIPLKDLPLYNRDYDDDYGNRTPQRIRSPSARPR